MEASEIVAVCSIVVAVLALAVSIYQSRLARQHARQSVRPALQLGTSFRTGERAGLRMINAGLGPAVITWSAVTMDGELVGEYGRETSNQIRGERRPRPLSTTFERGSILAADYDEFLFSVPDYDPNESWHATFADLVQRRIRVEIGYESLYGGERFTVAAGAPRQPED